MIVGFYLCIFLVLTLSAYFNHLYLNGPLEAGPSWSVTYANQSLLSPMLPNKTKPAHEHRIQNQSQEQQSVTQVAIDA